MRFHAPWQHIALTRWLPYGKNCIFAAKREDGDKRGK
jgi:hypothetical protein